MIADGGRDRGENLLSAFHELTGTPEYIAEQLWVRADLWPLTLGELRPGLEHDQSEFPPGASVRTCNCLNRAGVDSWHRLARMALTELLAIPNFGRKSFREVVVFSLLAEGGDPLSASSLEDQGEVDQESHESSQHQAEVSSFMASLREATLASGARSLVEAAQCLEIDYIAGYSNSTQLDRLLDFQATSEDIWNSFFEFSATDLKILDRRVLAGEKPDTLSQLAEEIGVTRERVRQRQTAVRDTLTKRLFGEPEFEGIQLLARRFGLDIESAIGKAELDDAAATMVEKSNIPPEFAGLGARLLVKFGGPFEKRNDMLMRGETLQQFDSLKRAIDGIDFGNLLTDREARYRLELANESGRFPDGWLEEVLQLRTVSESVVRWGGSMADMAYGVLAANGEAMEMDEIHLQVGFDRNPRSLSGQVQNDDRILRVGRSLYGLSEWGRREYLGVEESIAQAIEDSGGSIEIEVLVEQLGEEFSIPESSVRSYSSSRRFSKNEVGQLTINDQGSSPILDIDPGSSSSLVWSRSGWCLKIVVDEDALRGSGRPIGQAAALLAGLDHDVVLGYEYDGGMVTFSWSGRQPSLGSIKTTLERLGAKFGDFVFLPLESEEPRRATLVTTSELASLTGGDLLGALLGIATLDQEELREQVSESLGLPRSSDWEDVRARLEARKDHDLAKLVPLP